LKKISTLKIICEKIEELDKRIKELENIIFSKTISENKEIKTNIKVAFNNCIFNFNCFECIMQNHCNNPKKINYSIYK
jgi:hypothetical protein